MSSQILFFCPSHFSAKLSADSLCRFSKPKWKVEAKVDGKSNAVRQTAIGKFLEAFAQLGPKTPRLDFHPEKFAVENREGRKPAPCRH